MTTVDRVPAEGARSEGTLHRTWFIAAIILVAAVAVGLGVLWIAEMNTTSDLEGDLSAVQAELATSDAEVATLETSLAASSGDVATLEAQIATLEAAAAGAMHPMQVEVQQLYDAFLVAIAEPDAETISALFTYGAVHEDAYGRTMVGAAAIGEGYEEFGPLIVTDPGTLLVHGDGPYVAAMTGTVRGNDGLLVTTLSVRNGELLISNMRWIG